MALVAGTGTVDRTTPFGLSLAVSREDFGNPFRVVVADIAEHACHRENLSVTVAVDRFSAVEGFEAIDNG